MTQPALNGFEIADLCHLSRFYFARTEDKISQFTLLSNLPKIIFLKWRIRASEIAGKTSQT